MSERKYFLVVEEPESKPGGCYPGDALELVYQTLEEILVTLEKTRDFVASLVSDAPLEVTSRSWRDKLEDPSTCSITVGWRWFTDEPEGLI